MGGMPNVLLQRVRLNSPSKPTRYAPDTELLAPVLHGCVIPVASRHGCRRQAQVFAPNRIGKRRTRIALPSCD